jgi:serine carboxypeptidase-like clade 4
VDQVLFNNKGCSSEIAIFYENGPFKVVNNKLTKNKYSWNKIANLLYLDFPSSIGFS